MKHSLPKTILALFASVCFHACSKSTTSDSEDRVKALEAEIASLKATKPESTGDLVEDYVTEIDKLIQTVKSTGKALDKATNAEDTAKALNVYADQLDRFLVALARFIPDDPSKPTSLTEQQKEKRAQADKRMADIKPEHDAVALAIQNAAVKFNTSPSVIQAAKRILKR